MIPAAENQEFKLYDEDGDGLLTPEDPAPAAGNAEPPSVRAVLADGYLVELTPQSMDEKSLIGTSPVLGRCEIPVDAIRELHFDRYDELDPSSAYADWKPQPAQEPRFPGADGNGSP